MRRRTLERPELQALKTIGAVALSVLLLAGCGRQPSSDANDPYAGLDQEIRAWKADITANDRSCRGQTPQQKCEMFEVSCKAQREITPQEKAAGVTAKLVADMSWSGFDATGASQTASADALFVKTNGAWTRTPHKPVNPETCADL